MATISDLAKFAFRFYQRSESHVCLIFLASVCSAISFSHHQAEILPPTRKVRITTPTIDQSGKSCSGRLVNTWVVCRMRFYNPSPAMGMHPAVSLLYVKTAGSWAHPRFPWTHTTFGEYDTGERVNSRADIFGWWPRASKVYLKVMTARISCNVHIRPQSINLNVVSKNQKAILIVQCERYGDRDLTESFVSS